MPIHPSPALRARPLRAPWYALAALVSSVLVAACGGGSGEATATASTATSSAASTAASQSYADGPITGFGSIFVGGVRYDESSASIEDEDGNVVSRSELKLGTRVQVDASGMDRAKGLAMARRVRFGPEVVGPANSVDSGAGSLVVLGQKVVTTTSTVLDESIVGGLSAITPGTVLQVNGLLDPVAGQIVATRIEPKTSPQRYVLRGAVSGLDTAAKTLRIGTEVINYANVPRVPPNLANVVIVRVALQTAQVNGEWVATHLVGGLRAPDALAEAKVEGVINSFSSSASFEVNGVKVNASNAVFEDGTAGVVLGARVEVVGKMTDGVLVASKVELDQDRKPEIGKRPIEIRGSITAIDTTAKTFALRGLTIWYGGTVEYRDGNEAALAVGRPVEVKATLSTSRVRLDAQRIEFK